MSAAPLMTAARVAADVTSLTSQELMFTRPPERRAEARRGMRVSP
jgi:hypothetical protein